jgi:16S rRNA (guanine527-N7)-methyltransferase
LSSDAFREALVEAAPEYGVDLSAETIERFARHFELLVVWNRKVNLTRILEPRESARRHFLESAFLAAVVEAPQRLVDVGSGAGFPGVPLACIWPEAETLLVEPLVKRAVFLKEVVHALGLERVKVRNARFSSEMAGRDALLVARAVDRFDTLLPTLLGSEARQVALFSEPDLLASASALAGDRSGRTVPIPAATRRCIGLFTR